jgi:hypothetical protein
MRDTHGGYPDRPSKLYLRDIEFAKYFGEKYSGMDGSESTPLHHAHSLSVIVRDFYIECIASLKPVK